MITETCDYHDTWDIGGEPTGPRCGKVATHAIIWLDGSRRFSLGCVAHGHFSAIDPGAGPYLIVELAYASS